MPDWDRIRGASAGEPPRKDRPSGQVSAEAFRTVVRDSAEGIVLADADGRILYANPACERLFGIPAAELVGRFGLELTAPEHVLLARQIFRRVMASPGEPVLSTVDLIHPGGGVVTVDVTAVNHLSTPGVEALVGYFREASAAGSGASLGEAYRALFDNALVGLGVADMEGNLIAFNDAMLRPGGYTREDIVRIGNVGKLYAHDADRARMLQLLRAQGYVWREPIPFLRKDGSEYETLMTLTPVSFLGRPCLYATVEVVDERGHPGPAR